MEIQELRVLTVELYVSPLHYPICNAKPAVVNSFLGTKLALRFIESCTTPLDIVPCEHIGWYHK
jgi:hypothetical protein